MNKPIFFWLMWSVMALMKFGAGMGLTRLDKAGQPLIGFDCFGNTNTRGGLHFHKIINSLTCPCLLASWSIFFIGWYLFFIREIFLVVGISTNDFHNNFDSLFGLGLIGFKNTVLICLK